MNNRTEDQQNTSPIKTNQSKTNKSPITIPLIQNKEPDRTFYVKDKISQLNKMLNSTARDLYNSLSMTFALDAIDFSRYKKIIWPIISSGAAFVATEWVTAQMTRLYDENEEYDFVLKFILGSAILSYCAMQRITENRLQSDAAISAAVASEVVGITYLYTSTFHAGQLLLEGNVSDNYALIASLGASTLVVPAAVSYMARQLQEKMIKKLYVQGAQRSDTASIISGLTPVSNIYFQVNNTLSSELLTGSRLFQLGLIFDNILNAQRILQRFRNLPALIADVGPATIKSLLTQHEKLETDYQFNTSTQKVLRFSECGSELIDVPRYKLRNGDLVYCDKDMDLSAVPVSGELIAFQKNSTDEFIQSTEQKKFSVNLKAHNGEDVWIELKSKPDFSSMHTQIDLHAIHDGKQAGVLSGDQLNLYGADNFFIQIKSEKERILINDYKKSAVINDIINERKQKNILYSFLSAIVMASFLHKDITQLPAESIRLMFSLFQMMIPFSENFLRELINSRLMNEINSTLDTSPLETIDALRIVDLCNAIGGYYSDRFPQGAAIVSDKTGTLTTTKMDMLGIWTSDMSPEAQDLLQSKNKKLLPDESKQQECFEVFASAFTNAKKDLEPEEFSILKFLTSPHTKGKYLSENSNKNHLKVVVAGNNHFKKTLRMDDKQKEIETFHLGLYRSLGGRLTLVKDGEQNYLVFCGVPKREKFSDTQLYETYHTMHSRTGVLSRDWCIARTPISSEEFKILNTFFEEDQKKPIEEFILTNKTILKNLKHYCTFLINNPVKKGAQKFISQCKSINVPVFVATGDTAKASENVAHVLFPENTKSIFIVQANAINEPEFNRLLAGNLTQATIIFVGINPTILQLFKKILELPAFARPHVIFSEMSTEEKGILTQFLRDHSFFVVANGDGTNDIMMMKNSHVVISHLNEEGMHAPGVAQLSNLNDHQLQSILNSDQSFYELFEMNPNSAFTKAFAPLANSQEKPTIALALKSSKMGFELANAAGVPDVKEMPQQHWFGVAFDLIWVWLAYQSIATTTDSPLDREHLNRSNLVNVCLLAGMAFACLQAIATYALTGETTNLSCIILMLGTLPVLLKSIFSGYRYVQNELQPEIPEQKDKHPSSSFSQSVKNFFGSFFQKPQDGQEHNRHLQGQENLIPKPFNS